MKKVLMVCLGNICRSPIAEGVFQETIEKENLSEEWSVDSAAIGSWHVGNKPDHRALKIMKNHGIDYKNRARQIKTSDFSEFDYIFGMDEENIEDLKRKAPVGSKAKILMLGDFGLDKSNRIIRDPYYDSGDSGFETAYQQCVIACKAFLEAAQAAKV